MSTELIKARKRLANVNTNLKKAKYMPAIQSIHEALTLILKQPLMKNEKEEFAGILRDVVTNLNNNPGIREIYPLVINYEMGKERELLEAMRELLVEMQKVVTKDAQSSAAEFEQHKAAELAKGQEKIDQQKYGEAKTIFDALTKEYKTDTDLKADIADRFLKAGRYEEAFAYLDQALKFDPNAIHLYNRIGMVLRKMKDFDTAERYYDKALELTQKDEYLYFNIGRLYIDWGKWDKVVEASEKALKVNPEFNEAQKMLLFAQKKLGA